MTRCSSQWWQLFIEQQASSDLLVRAKSKIGKASWAFNHIQKLYRIEARIKEMSAQEKYCFRQQEALPLLIEL